VHEPERVNGKVYVDVYADENVDVHLYALALVHDQAWPSSFASRASTPATACAREVAGGGTDLP
jgi:hypothetical protein